MINEHRIIGIIGSRSRNSSIDYDICEKKFNELYQDGDWIVSGGCPLGGDNFAEKIARKLGLTILIHHANWNKYGKSAGFKRNGFIARDSDILIACVTEDKKSGTRDTVEKFLLFKNEKDLHLV